MKFMFCLFLLFQIANLSYTNAIKQLHQEDSTLIDDFKKFEKYLNPPENSEQKQSSRESVSTKDSSEVAKLDPREMAQCKLCESMFEIEFNIDKFLVNKEKISEIKRFFNKIIEKDQLNQIFSDENLGFILKEISMQYFFKGEDKQIKVLKEKSKLNACEYILGFEGVCTKLSTITTLKKKINIASSDSEELKTISGKQNISHTSNDNRNNKSKSSMEKKSSNSDLLGSIAKLLASQSKDEDPKLISGIRELLLNSGRKETKNTSIRSSLPEDFPRFKETNSLTAKTNNKIKTLIKTKKPIYKNDINLKDIMGMLDNNNGRQESVNPRSQQKELYGEKEDQSNINPKDMSLIQLSPEYIAKNFDSRPKTHWLPPKPVLLKNFETSIGMQLGDIGRLTTEIAELEKVLKSKKQELANKLEVAQTSYNVVQRTLTQISKLVNGVGVPVQVKQENCTDDDWEESEKKPNKFLNGSG